MQANDQQLGRTFVCPVCDHTFPQRTTRESQSEHLTCAQCCTLVLRDPSSSKFAPYPEEYFGGPNAKFRGVANTARRFWHRRRARRLRALLGPGTFRVYDIGCGDGTFLEACDAEGFEVAGFEPEPLPRQQASDRLGISIDESLFAGQGSDDFDVITLWQVVEHVAAPRALLRAAQKRLGAQGLVALSTVNLDSWQSRLFGDMWLHLDPPRHLWVSGRRACEKLVEQSGLKIIKRVWNHLEFGPIGYVDSLLNFVYPDRDRLLDRLKHGFHGLSDRMLWSAAAAITPFAVLASAAESAANNPATFELYARPRRESLSPADPGFSPRT